jgi:hypothetical protein
VGLHLGRARNGVVPDTDTAEDFGKYDGGREIDGGKFVEHLASRLLATLDPFVVLVTLGCQLPEELLLSFILGIFGEDLKWISEMLRTRRL